MLEMLEMLQVWDPTDQKLSMVLKTPEIYMNVAQQQQQGHDKVCPKAATEPGGSADISPGEGFLHRLLIWRSIDRLPEAPDCIIRA
jgi:hypothetical protein